jgi:hypothetical protein
MMANGPLLDQIEAAVGTLARVQGMTLAMLLRRGSIDRSDVEKILAVNRDGDGETRLHASTVEGIMDIMRSALDPAEPSEEQQK